MTKDKIKMKINEIKRTKNKTIGNQSPGKIIRIGYD